MNERRISYWVAVALVVLCAGCVAARSHFRQATLLAHDDTLWRILYNITFQAQKPQARLRIAYPADTAQGRVFRQEVSYSGLSPDRRHTAHSETREVNLVTDRGGPYRLAAEFDVHVSPGSRWRPTPVSTALTPDARGALLRSTKTLQCDSPAVLRALQEIRGQAAPEGDPVKAIFEHCVNTIAIGSAEDPQDAAGAIEKKQAAPGGRAAALVALCRAAKYPARLVAGFVAQHGRQAHPEVWAEVLEGAKWQSYDPDNGFFRELPANYLPVRRESDEVVWGSDLRDLKVDFSIAKIPPPPGVLVPGRRTAWEILDLTRLPLETHHVLSLILLMPLGALVTSLVRTVIGLRTFGTFTPTLLALSFVYADWRTGLLVFGVVITLGLTSRRMLDRLKLLLVPRLSVILTLVVLCMVFCVSLLAYYRLTPTPQAVLLPMVILTMTIERFFIKMEEDGSRYAFGLLGLTVVVAFVCYLILRWDEVGRVLLAFPEIHLGTVAVLILLGRYTGYRLTELWRFRDLGQGPGREG